MKKKNVDLHVTAGTTVVLVVIIRCYFGGKTSIYKFVIHIDFVTNELKVKHTKMKLQCKANK